MYFLFTIIHEIVHDGYPSLSTDFEWFVVMLRFQNLSWGGKLLCFLAGYFTYYWL